MVDEGRSWWLDHCPVAPPPLAGPDVLEGTAAGVVVVGLGASGLEAVVRLSEAGADVLGLDAVGVAAAASGANGGFLLAGLADFHHDAVLRHGRDAAVAWWRRTEAELDRLAEVEPTFRRVGSLRIAASDTEVRDIAAQVAAMHGDRIDVEHYDGPEGIGLLVPGDGAVHPVARCRRLATQALRAGARLIAQAPVTAIQPGRVDVAGHSVRCRAVLVAVDGGLEHIPITGPDGPVHLVGIRTARLQMLATDPDPAVSLPRPVYRRHGYDYALQLPGGEVLLGGGRDVGGEEEWDVPPVPSPTVQAHLERWAAALGVTAPVSRRWAAHAAFTDKRLPRAAEVAPRITVVGGHSGHGNVLGGLLARDAAAQILTGMAAT